MTIHHTFPTLDFLTDEALERIEASKAFLQACGRSKTTAPAFRSAMSARA